MHISRYRHRSTAAFERFVRETVPAIAPAFVVVTGDITDGGCGQRGAWVLVVTCNLNAAHGPDTSVRPTLPALSPPFRALPPFPRLFSRSPPFRALSPGSQPRTRTRSRRSSTRTSGRRMRASSTRAGWRRARASGMTCGATTIASTFPQQRRSSTTLRATPARAPPSTALCTPPPTPTTRSSPLMPGACSRRPSHPVPVHPPARPPAHPRTLAPSHPPTLPPSLPPALTRTRPPAHPPTSPHPRLGADRRASSSLGPARTRGALGRSTFSASSTPATWTAWPRAWRPPAASTRRRTRSCLGTTHSPPSGASAPAPATPPPRYSRTAAPRSTRAATCTPSSVRVLGRPPPSPPLRSDAHDRRGVGVGGTHARARAG